MPMNNDMPCFTLDHSRGKYIQKDVFIEVIVREYRKHGASYRMSTSFPKNHRLHTKRGSTSAYCAVKNSPIGQGL